VLRARPIHPAIGIGGKKVLRARPIPRGKRLRDLSPRPIPATKVRISTPVRSVRERAIGLGGARTGSDCARRAHRGVHKTPRRAQCTCTDLPRRPAAHAGSAASDTVTMHLLLFLFSSKKQDCRGHVTDVIILKFFFFCICDWCINVRAQTVAASAAAAVGDCGARGCVYSPPSGVRARAAPEIRRRPFSPVCPASLSLSLSLSHALSLSLGLSPILGLFHP